MNTEHDLSPSLPSPDASALQTLDIDSSHEKLTRALASAQEELADLKDKRREERFAWIVVLVLVIDCSLLLNASNWSGPVIIGLIQIGGLSVLAARLGVEEFAALFKAIFFRATDMLGRD